MEYSNNFHLNIVTNLHSNPKIKVIKHIKARWILPKPAQKTLAYRVGTDRNSTNSGLFYPNILTSLPAFTFNIWKRCRIIRRSAQVLMLWLKIQSFTSSAIYDDDILGSNQELIYITVVIPTNTL